MAKTVSPYKGKLVHLRKTWGENAGSIQDEYLYKVRSCGPKMAVLDRVNSETHQPENSRYRRGQSYYLSTPGEVEITRADNAREPQGRYRQYKFSDWSQFFVPIGEAGWDPPQNF